MKSKKRIRVHPRTRTAREGSIDSKKMTGEYECKPELVYPCPWVYKVIGRDVGLLRNAVAEVLSGRTYSIMPSRSSKGGAYHCLNVETTVVNEPDRIGFYEKLRRHPAVIMVL